MQYAALTISLVYGNLWLIELRLESNNGGELSIIFTNWISIAGWAVFFISLNYLVTSVYSHGKGVSLSLLII